MRGLAKANQSLSGESLRRDYMPDLITGQQSPGIVHHSVDPVRAPAVAELILSANLGPEQALQLPQERGAIRRGHEKQVALPIAHHVAKPLDLVARCVVPQSFLRGLVIEPCLPDFGGFGAEHSRYVIVPGMKVIRRNLITCRLSALRHDLEPKVRPRRDSVEFIRKRLPDGCIEALEIGRANW